MSLTVALSKGKLLAGAEALFRRARLPFPEAEGRRLVVAMANPTNIFAIDDIKFITGYDVDPHVASEGSLKRALDRAYD